MRFLALVGLYVFGMFSLALAVAVGVAAGLKRFFDGIDVIDEEKDVGN